MGWTYLYKPHNVRQYFEESFGYQRPDGSYGKVIAFAMRGYTEAYGAYEIKYADGEKRVVGLAIMLRFTRDGQMGYKDMDESVGPNISNCPESILKLLTPLKDDEQYAKDWRQRCWDRINGRKKLKLAVGATLKFKTPLSFGNCGQCDTFVVKSVKPLRFDAGYFTARIRRDTLARAMQDGELEITP